nr:MAG: hypothetical protein [Bacteriophage sp.]
MEELFEELKHHDFEEIYFVAERYEVHLSDGITIITMDSQQMLNSLLAIRTASNHDARADDSEGGCRE